MLHERECPVKFGNTLKKYADQLLSISTSETDGIAINDDYQALILLMCKLFVAVPDILNPGIAQQLFRTIIAFSLHFYGVSRQKYSEFVNEWPIAFTKSFTSSILTNFINSKEVTLNLLASASLFLFIYFPDDSLDTPFLTVLTSIDESSFGVIFESLRFSLTSTLSALLFYTLLVYCNQFKPYCLSCVEIDWIMSLINPISHTNPATSELRLSILLMLSEDQKFIDSISNNNLLLTVLEEIVAYIKKNAFVEQARQSVTTALTLLLNLGQKISNIESDSCDTLIFLLKSISKKIKQAPYLENTFKLLLLLLESIATYRGKNNPELIYCMMRSSDYFKQLTHNYLSTEESQIMQCITNINHITTYFLNLISETDSFSLDYNKMIQKLNEWLESWAPESILIIHPYPMFKYVTSELNETQKYFRLIILKEVQELLSK